MTGDNFFDRWSRRKRDKNLNKRPARAFSTPAPERTETPEGAEPKHGLGPESAANQQAPLAASNESSPPDPGPDQKAAGETAQRPDLPDPETLTYESDFSGFLKEGVSEEVRRLALRKLWRSNPVLANLDGLNDYDEDFRKEAILGKLKTAYDSVKGFGRSDASPEEEPEKHQPLEGSEPGLDESLEAEDKARDESQNESADVSPDVEENGSKTQA